MATGNQPLGLLPQHIPMGLQGQPRFCTWLTRWDDRRKKWDKVPTFPSHPVNGLSTNEHLHWTTCDVALASWRANLGKTFDRKGVKYTMAGIGYVMTGPHGVVGIDLDHCVDEHGEIAPWAREVIEAVGSYAERSPSGTGVRIFCCGDIDQHDVINTQVGIEMYSGNSARFLTVTGQHIEGTPEDLTTPDPKVIEALVAKYRVAEPVNVNLREQPDILDPLLIENWETTAIDWKARNFLANGTVKDGSAELNYAARALFAEGFVAQAVFSILVHNRHAMDVALRHRRDNYDKAIDYIWEHHCLQPEAKQMATHADFAALGDALDAFDKVGQDDVIEVQATEVPEPMFEALEGPPAPAAAPVQTTTTFHLTDVIDFLKRSPPVWLIKRVLPKAALAVLFGKSGSGKSFIALDMAMAMARGVDWRGRKVKRSRVVYVAAEGVAGFRNRIDAYIRHHQLDPAEFAKWFKVITRAPNMMDKNESVQLCKDILTWGRVDLVIVDTFAQVTPGANENAGEDMGRALGHCKGINTATGAMVMLVHHAGKDESKGARGWSGLRAAADVEMSVVDDGPVRVLEITKQKDGEQGERFGFTLAKVPLGMDEDGETYDSCVCMEAQAPAPGPAAPAPASKPKSALAMWMDALLQVIDDTGQITGLVREEMLEAANDMIPAADKPALKKNQRTSALRAWNQLIADGVLQLENVNDVEGTVCLKTLV